MAISYTVSRWDVSCEAGSTNVCSVVLGITATHDSGASAYKDERISVPCQNLTEFEAGAEAFIEGVLGSQGWYLELQTRIANQMTAPVAAPEDRTKPDFSSMTIGDGYQELPSETDSEGEPSEETPTEETSAEEESSDGSEE